MPNEPLPLTPLSMAILLALAGGDRHGYTLMQEIEEQTDGALRPGQDGHHREIGKSEGTSRHDVVQRGWPGTPDARDAVARK
jgi:hypothetical protein